MIPRLAYPIRLHAAGQVRTVAACPCTALALCRYRFSPYFDSLRPCWGGGLVTGACRRLPAADRVVLDLRCSPLPARLHPPAFDCPLSTNPTRAATRPRPIPLTLKTK